MNIELAEDQRGTPPSWLPVVQRVAYFITIYLLPALVLILAWDLASRAFGIERLFPSPAVTLETLITMTLDGSLLSNSIASLSRILVGFTIGSVLGIIFGLLMGTWPVIRYLLTPYVDFLRFVSAVAWISAFLIWFGIGETSKVMLLVYATTFGVAINVAAGVVVIPQNKLRVAHCFGATRAQTFFWVILPATVPHIIAGMRMSMQNSFMAIVAAEMIAASKGLGYVIMSARTFLAPDRIFVAIFALGILGFLTDRLLVLLANFFLRRYQMPDSG